MNNVIASCPRQLLDHLLWQMNVDIMTVNIHIISIARLFGQVHIHTPN